VSAPPHVRAAQRAYWESRLAWEARRDAETRGWIGSDEERDFEASDPAPTFKELLRQFSRECLTR
jgi:hypothetical protein